ncbi:hypothetical protein PENTCL1PPCAC_2644, partial [Pristionchus entomophagus]
SFTSSSSPSSLSFSSLQYHLTSSIIQAEDIRWEEDVLPLGIVVLLVISIPRPVMEDIIGSTLLRAGASDVSSMSNIEYRLIALYTVPLIHPNPRPFLYIHASFLVADILLMKLCYLLV